MKRIKYIILVVAFIMVLTSCKNNNENSSKNETTLNTDEEHSNALENTKDTDGEHRDSSENNYTTDSENGGESENNQKIGAIMERLKSCVYLFVKSINGQEYSNNANGEGAETTKFAHATVGVNGAKAVTDVMLIPHEDIDISRDVSFRDMYGQHVLHSGVVGLVGAPVEVQFDLDEVDGGTLVFVYDPDELKGVRPDALMFMWYDEENDYYQEMLNGVLDTENCSISIEIDKPGVYLLVNMYTWFNAWGADLDDDGLDGDYDSSKEPISIELWEMNETVGDIPELANEKYIKSCARADGIYYFEVSNPVQLASAVYFVNCANENGKYPVYIELINDIDLEGYEWAPMGWYTAGVDYDFTGVVNGNGHTIKNMNISNYSYAGFIGMGLNCTVTDLNFENAYVSGRNPGIIIGYARSSEITGCSVQGETNGIAAGTVVGIDQSSRLSDCTADVISDGKNISDFLAGNDRAAAEVAEKHEITETLWLDENNRPTREEGLENEYSNIGWLIKRDGVQILRRNAVDETSLPWQDYDLTRVPGHYEVTLTAYVEGYYIPISNTVEYDVE